MIKRKITVLSMMLFIGMGLTAQKKKITNDLIWASRTFSAQNVYGVESMKDGQHFTRLEYDREMKAMVVRKYEYKTNKAVQDIVSDNDLVYNGTQLSIDEYTFNADETKILIATNQESIYRHSSKSFYYIFDVKSKSIRPLSDPKMGKQRLASFSPDGNMVAFVRNNDMFIAYLEGKTEVQITNDGKMNEVINGATDWVYEEEFGSDVGFYWSPNSTKIAYYKFNESEVKQYSMPMYGSLYPDMYTFKYPKAGEDNSYVEVYTYEIAQNKTRKFNIGDEGDYYLPRFLWANDGNTLLVEKMNRLQNKIELLQTTYDPNANPISEPQTKVVFTEEAKTYVDIHDNTMYTEDDSEILWTSEMDGYNHIYFINVANGEYRQVTDGQWEVTEVYGYDEKSGYIYFQAAKESATQRELYKVKSSGEGLVKISDKPGTTRAEFSDDYSNYLSFHSDANTPFTVKIHDNSKKRKKRQPITIVDNKELKERMSTFDISAKTFFTVKNNEGTDLNAWMIKPSNFNEKKEYPVLMFVYGGPGINTVNDSWSYGNYFWFQSLAQQGYIVVSVDARGTGYRGRAFKHSTYLQLGKYETEDQIAAAQNLGKMSYIDKDRIGIFGWSYGGYMSSLCISKGADTFKAAIAVAPVTNWRYYDNIYTERFMRTPQENGENYDINSPINHVDKIKGKYLLVHGSADDNVHFQNAMEMNFALVKNNIPFDFMAYTNQNHGIRSDNSRQHLYNMMTKFLLENL